jgi:hypothetical protein
MSNTVTLGTADFRQALLSVAPHADQDADFPPLHRVRVDVATVNATVTATNRYTAGHALVSVESDDGTGEIWHVDLSPTDVKEILTLFKTKGDSEPDDKLRLDVDEKHTTITDAAGMFDGKSLSLPRYPDETNFPNVPRLIAGTLSKPPHGASRLVADGAKVALFNAAAKAYGEPLVIEPTGENTALVLSCGESFLGLLMPMRQDEETDARQGAWRDAWLRRLPVLEDAAS